MSSFRFERLQTRLWQILNELIVSNKIKDHRVSSMLSVSAVELSRDGVYAKVKVSGYLGKRELEEGVAGLNHAAGFIQKVLSTRLSPRHTPKLTFVKDEGLLQSFEITKRLKNIGE